MEYMGDFVRGETNTIIGTVNKDISSASNIEMWINTFNETFVKNKGEFAFTSVTGGKTIVGYKMSQEESLSCCEDYISVQLRWIMSDGTVGATKRKLLSIDSADWDNRIPSDVNSGSAYNQSGIDRITEPEISTMIATEDRK